MVHKTYRTWVAVEAVVNSEIAVACGLTWTHFDVRM